MKNCSSQEGLMSEKFMDNCLLWEGPHTGTGDESEEEEEAKKVCDELNTTSIPSPQGKEVEKSLRKRGGGGGERQEVWFKILFYFSFSYSDLG